MAKTFDINRFMQLSKWSVYTYKKEYITTVTMATVIFFIILFMRFNLMGLNDVIMDGMETFSHTAVGLLMFIFSISGCYLLNNMKTKQQRLMFKLLPASDAEKFLARYLYVTVFWIVGCIVAYCIADVLRLSLSLITGHGMQTTTIPYFFTALTNTVTFNNVNDTADAIFSVEMLMFTHSLYLLGGTLFRRLQFVLTSMTMILGTILLAWVASWFVGSYSFNISTESLKGFVYFIMCLLPVLTAAAYWLSYRIFKRMQVVNNKWINL